MKYLILLLLVGCGARVTETAGFWTCRYQPSFLTHHSYEFEGPDAQINAHKICNKLSKGEHIIPEGLEKETEKGELTYYDEDTK